MADLGKRPRPRDPYLIFRSTKMKLDRRAERLFPRQGPMLSLGLDERVPTYLKFCIRRRTFLFSSFFFLLRTSILSRGKGGTERFCDSQTILMGDMSLKKPGGSLKVILFSSTQYNSLVVTDEEIISRTPYFA